MGLHLHRSERADALVDGLGDLLSRAPRDPFAPELVVVPTRGMERYIGQRLSMRLGAAPGSADGVCANVGFSSPAALLSIATGQPDDDPWAPRRLLWRLLEIIDASMEQAWCGPLASHLLDSPTRARSQRRWATAAHIAELFASYAEQRPDMVRGWGTGEFGGIPGDLEWQVHLWRRLAETIGPSPAERPLVDDERIPSRISYFAPTRIPHLHRELLTTLSQARDVHLWIADPSPVLWSQLAGAPRPSLRRDDRSRDHVVQPLLRSLGRDTRELRLVLDHFDTDEHRASPTNRVTLLGFLQRQIADNFAGELPEPDGSIQVHSCHGALRQVEVLREVLMGLLADNPDLEPRDILVLSPDPTVFASLLGAAFAGTPLPLSIANQSAVQDNEVLAALDAVLALFAGRWLLSEIVDLLRLGAVLRRLGWTADDVERLEELAISARVRWGYDDSHRGEFGVDGIPEGTWRWALDRMLLGVAMSDEGLHLFGDALPLPDVRDTDLRILGAIAELLDELDQLRLESHEAKQPDQWLAWLFRVVDTVAAGSHGDIADAQAAVSNAFGIGAAPQSTHQMSLAEVRQLLRRVLAGRAGASGLLTGRVTAARLEPMRPIPAPVICLLGMDDGAFPRDRGADGDDVLLIEPRVGERDSHSEDRQVFLDAIMAAQRHLVICYDGQDEHDNSRREPCVPLAELIDLLPGRADVVVHHPLQPFDGRNFQFGGVIPGRVFSHDTGAMAAASVRDSAPPARRPLIDAPIPLGSDFEPTIASLAKFLKDPPATFLTQRLGMMIAKSDVEAPERIPLELAGLGGWEVAERIVESRLAGGDVRRVLAAEHRRGTLPPLALGDLALEDKLEEVEHIVGDALAARTEAARQVTVDVEVGPFRLRAEVPDIYGTTIVRATFSRHKPKHLLGVWPELLALAVAHPAERWSARVFAKGAEATLTAPAAATAAELLAGLIALERSAAEFPMPLMPATGHAYAAKRRAGKDNAESRQAAHREWAGDYGEQREQSIVVVYGQDAPFSLVLSAAATPEEARAWPDDALRFEALARTVWNPVLEHSKVTKWKRK